MNAPKLNHPPLRSLSEVQAERELNSVRRLPDLETVAPTMSEFFGPDDCVADEILIRCGRIQRAEGVHDCVLVAVRRRPGTGGVNALLTLNMSGKWVIQTNIAGDDFDLLRTATEEVIGARTYVPEAVVR